MKSNSNSNSNLVLGAMMEFQKVLTLAKTEVLNTEVLPALGLIEIEAFKANMARHVGG
jgi:hypothetical protein